MYHDSHTRQNRQKSVILLVFSIIKPKQAGQKWRKIPLSFPRFCRFTRKILIKHPFQSGFYNTKNVRLLSVCLSVHCPSVSKIGYPSPFFKHSFNVAKSLLEQYCGTPVSPHPKHAKSPQNKPFKTILRAKYNFSKPKLNFCNKKRAFRPSKIKPKYKFWYSLF